MELFVTCECTRRTTVTIAKCGEHISCLCGKSNSVPPLSVLKTQCHNYYVANGEEIPTSRYASSKVARPIRPIPLVFSALLLMYAAFQLLRLPVYFKLGPQPFGFAIGIAALAFVGSVLLYKASVKAD